MTSYARRVDDNHYPILNTLRRSGFAVMDTHTLGLDMPDAVVSLRGETALVEIKNPATKGKQTKGQKTFFDLWQGKKIVAYYAEDVLREFGLIK